MENPVVLKTDKKPAKDNGKRYEDCINRGWKGLIMSNQNALLTSEKRGRRGKPTKQKPSKSQISGHQDAILL